MNMNFFMPTKLVSGTKAVEKNSQFLRELGKSCLIVTGGSSAKKSGALDDIVKALTKENIEYDVFDSIEPNPLISSCYAAGCKARKIGAQFIIGVGGGSVLDASKAIGIYSANSDLTPMDIYKRNYENEPLPIALVGTTAGTGSEVTSVAVLTIDESGRKKSIAGVDCYAKISFLDAQYTHTVAPEVTASTALDALAHTVEGWFSPRMNDLSKLYAVKALTLIWKNIKCLNSTKALPNEKQREELYFGSVFAGLVINTCGTGFPHPLGYVLTENYNVPHGKACAAFMPKFLERAEKFKREELNELLEIVGETRKSFSDTVKSLADVKHIKISEQDAVDFSMRWKDNLPKNFEASPGGLTQVEASEILMELND